MAAFEDNGFNRINDGNLRLVPDWEANPQDWSTGSDGKHYRLVPLPDAPLDVVDRWRRYLSGSWWSG